MVATRSQRDGKFDSSKPYRVTPPEWVEYKPEEVESLVVKLAGRGHSASMIGMILRDQHGVPGTKLTSGKRINQILDDHEIGKELPEDMMVLITRAVNLSKHLEQNSKDMTAKRGMQLTESKIRKLAKYYRREKRIPSDWKYNLKTAKLLVR
ncbi:MAG: 30S ribosomal protein S15 [Candidatus Hydrothermarchaeales archaeon]